MTHPMRTLALVVTLFTTASASAETQYYHLQRAVFRASAMNRGLAVDSQHFWVGEFGGWVRCYGLDGQRQSNGDLGSGAVKYLGHGVAACGDFVATGAWDVITIFPRAGGESRSIKPPIAGNPCAVASDGKTIWAMNYQSPVIYEMDLEGKLLRQFTTAQKSSPTSQDIAVDCDGHLYVLDGAGGGSMSLLEYLPDGKLVRTHNLAVKATAAAIDPKDTAKKLYTVTFDGDPVVYEYKLASGLPQGGALPRLAHIKYRPEGLDFVIENGTSRFNRPLYGSNTAFFVYAGDLPEFMLSLPAKGGSIRFGLIAGDSSKWLADAERVVARYRAGAMKYEITDAMLGPGSLTIDVIPRPESEGAIIRIIPSPDAKPVELVWAFGGATGEFQWSGFDTCGYSPESALWLKPESCVKHEFAIKPGGFELHSPAYTDRPLVGTVPPDTSMKITDANKLQSPRDLLASVGEAQPILAGTCKTQPGEPVWISLDRVSPNSTAPAYEAMAGGFEAAEARRKAVAERVKVSTPDPHINAAIPALCAAADGIWDPPVYVHGGVAWHMPYLGWRGAYVASDFGWFDRAKTHFREFAAVQLKEPADAPPKADEESNLARPAKDSVIYTRGYIPYHPKADERGPYDMQQVYIDQLLWHILWTGDLDFVREMWPTLVAHLDWEKRCFDPDNDGLYENLANTFISDAHHYSGSPCTQASAYNYRSLRMAARLARLIGKAPQPFDAEADKTLAAMNRVLWMADRGWYAEYRDLLGLQKLHPSAELPSIYHPIDSFVPDLFQSWQMLRYVDTTMERVPVDGDSVMLWSSNWVPFIWSVRDACGVEVAHTALANWQAGRPREAFDQWRGAIVDSMYHCRAPGACIGTSEIDGHMTGLCTDFADTVGMYARSLVEGLFGIVPDALEGELVIRPGFPDQWPTASIDTPDVGYTFARNGQTDSYKVRCHLPRPMRLRFQLAARAADIAKVTANGEPVKWQNIPAVGQPTIEIPVPSADGAVLEITWGNTAIAASKCPSVVGRGEKFAASFEAAKLCEIKDPQAALRDPVLEPASLQATAAGVPGHRTAFARVEQGQLSWWVPLEFEIRDALEVTQASLDPDGSVVQLAIRNNTDSPIAAQATLTCGTEKQAIALNIAPRSSSECIRLPARGIVPGTNPVTIAIGEQRSIAGSMVDWRSGGSTLADSLECIDLSSKFNDRVTEIFKHEYRAPRSPYCSMQMPLHGYGDWCYCGKQVPTIDDSALRTAAGEKGRFVSPQGIPFATPGPGSANNVLFTSRWENFPAESSIPLEGRARHAWFLVAGSTHAMHSQFDNGEIIVDYADGTSDRLPLHNPTTWWPIEGDYQVNIDGFCIPEPHPPRVDLGSGRATILDLPLHSDRPLRSLTLRCLANEVVVGLMSVTLQRDK